MRILIALLLTSTAASADPNAYGHTMPPARYTGTPPMPVNDNVLPLSEVQVECKRIGAIAPIGRYFLGCAQPTPHICTIYRINDELIRKHEFGHCAGWTGDHPNEAELRTRDKFESELKRSADRAADENTMNRTMDAALREVVPKIVIMPRETATLSPVKTVGASSVNPPTLEYPFGVWGPMKR